MPLPESCILAGGKPTKQRVTRRSHQVYDASQGFPDDDSFRRAPSTDRAVASSSFLFSRTDDMTWHDLGRNMAPKSAVDKASNKAASDSSILRQKSSAHERKTSTSSLPYRSASPSMHDLALPVVAGQDVRAMSKPSKKHVTWQLHQVAYDATQASSDGNSFQYTPSSIDRSAIKASRPSASILQQERRALDRNSSTSFLLNQGLVRPWDVSPSMPNLTPSQARMLRQQCRLQGVAVGSVSASVPSGSSRHCENSFVKPFGNAA